ncbi:MAG TPA: hypothetical protein VNM14_11170 [Planctomycetota bacterium]|nr:hypothetical protein [Planctomycetota bacterium]
MILEALALAFVAQTQPLNADETREFMKRLAKYVDENHLKKDPKSEQKGMVYEYFDTKRKGQFDQWVQGEALDTMHDGSWFAAALVNASRATGDPYYKDLLTQSILPFYLKMLNHSDTLFTATQDDVDAKGHRFGKEHLLQAPEKGFVPYWWDDGASVSLERRRSKIVQPNFSATDRMIGKQNPNFSLDGWSHGSSNHMAQDLGVLVQQTWLLLRESDPTLAAEVAEAAKNLQDCRTRHGFAGIPACAAAAALTNGDKTLMKRVPEPRDFTFKNHYVPALAPPDPSKTQSAPGFADDDEYEYYWGVARSNGELPRSLALKLVYDAYTHPMLFRYHFDNAELPPGVNIFDLNPFQFRGGKPTQYRSSKPLPTGSRFGTQNMVVCGWALQALKQYPGLWEERYKKQFSSDLRVGFGSPSEPVTLGELTLRLSSRRNALVVSGSSKGEKSVFRIFAQPDAKGPWAEVTVQKNGASAVNDAGEALKVEAKIDGPTFDVTLPYTVVKDQKPWANGLEQYRYTVAVGDATRTFYLASSEDQVKEALTKELGEGLRTWRTVLDEKGYIPTGDGPGWNQFSDTGGYAHLISAASQWILFLEGKRDWEVHKFPRPE